MVAERRAGDLHPFRREERRHPEPHAPAGKWPSREPARRRGDGKWASYFSDRSGEYALVIRGSRTASPLPARFPSATRSTVLQRPSRSPDSEEDLFTDTGYNVWVMDVASGRPEAPRQRSWAVPARYPQPDTGPATRSGTATAPRASTPRTGRDLRWRRTWKELGRRSRSPAASPTLRCSRAAWDPERKVPVVPHASHRLRPEVAVARHDHI